MRLPLERRSLCNLKDNTRKTPMSMLIEQVLSTTNPISEYVNGQSLVPFSESGERKTAALQVIPASDGALKLLLKVP